MPSPEPAAFPFQVHDYRIEGLPADMPDRVIIAARAGGALPLRVGDQYTVAGTGCFCELTVETVAREAEDGWTARCLVSRRFWL